MNNTLQQMTTRGSIRAFDPTKTLSKEALDQILSAAQQSPTYIHGQQYSIIVIQDPAQKEKMMGFTSPRSGVPQQYIKDCSAFLLFVMDFHKINAVMEMENQPLEITNHFESLLIGTVDVGIGIEAATVAAESLGLGTVMIGSIRRSLKDIVEEFHLPPYTFPIVGMCIGYPLHDSTIKPRLPKELFVHYGMYKTPSNIKELLEEYNTTMQVYYEKHINTPNFRWTTFISSFYSKAYFTENYDLYLYQQFKIK